MPGEFYVAVSLTRKSDDTSFTIPMTLTIGLQGTAGTGKPEYVNGATPVSGDSVTPSPTADPSQPSGEKTEAGGPVSGNGSSSGDGSGDGVPVGLVAGLGGGGLLLALLAVWAILRLRAKPAPVGGYPQQPQGQNPPYR